MTDYDDIEPLQPAPKGRPGRPPSEVVQARKQRELELKESALHLKKQIHSNRLRETEQKEELLEILRSIDSSLQVLTAAVVAHGTASAAIEMYKRNTTHENEKK